MKLGLLLLSLVTLMSVLSAQLTEPCSQDNCVLPDCFCASRRGPLQLSLQETPKIVLFTFDDAVNDENMKFYKRLFTKRRKNPNGCRMVATFFVSHDWTNYDMVKDLYLDGHEIASHSITHRLPRNWWAEAKYHHWQEELAGQRDNIVEKAKVPSSQIHGVRVPFLEIGADRQFKMMRDEEFEYDASFLTGPYSSSDWRQPVWPYTLDHAPNLEYCDNKNCPTGNFSGIWEIPMNRWIGLDGRACPMVDACTTQTLNTNEDASKYIWNNFDRHFNGNRAPLGVNMHATWFKTEINIEAMDDFVGELSKRDDVWVITMHQMIEWMRTPTSADQVKNFAPWQTSCKKGRMLVGTRGQVRRTSKPPVQENEEEIEYEYEEESEETTVKVTHPPRRKIQRKPSEKVLLEKTEPIEDKTEEEDLDQPEETTKANIDARRPQRPRHFPTRSTETQLPRHPYADNSNYPRNTLRNPYYRYTNTACSAHLTVWSLFLLVISMYF